MAVKLNCKTQDKPNKKKTTFCYNYISVWQAERKHHMNAENLQEGLADRGAGGPFHCAYINQSTCHDVGAHTEYRTLD